MAIQAATAEDIPAIVQVRLAALGDEEISGSSAAEFATFSSVKRLRGAWSKETG